MRHLAIRTGLLLALLAAPACEPTEAASDDPATTAATSAPQTTQSPSAAAGATAGSRTGTADPAAETVMGVIERNADFNQLRQALERADLTDALRRPGPFTVFAPTSVGFSTLREPELEVLRGAPDRAAELLLAHVVRGRWTTADLHRDARLQTLAGTTLRVERDAGGTITVNGLAEITRRNIPAGNGVVHAIDGFIVPEQEEPTAQG